MVRSNWIARIGFLSIITSGAFLQSSTNISNKDKGSDLYVPGSSFVLAANRKGSNPLVDQGEMYITYEPQGSSCCDKESIKARAMMMVAQSIAKQRLTSAMKKNFLYYDVYCGVKSFSPSFVSIEISYDINDEKQVLDFVEGQVDVVCRSGVHHDELYEAQKLLLEEVDHLLKVQKTEDELFIYKLHELEYLKEGATLSFEDFLLEHRRALLDIRSEEAFFALGRYLDYNNKILETISRKDIENDLLEDSFQGSLFSSLKSELSLDEESKGGFSTLKKGLSNVDAYYGLRLSEGDKKLIRKLITNLADKNVFQLLLDKKSMEKLGKQVRPVHPVRFIGYILADSHLRGCLHSISKNHFKWSSFVDGFKDRMKDEARRDGVNPYLPGFCQELGTEIGSIRSYTDRGDFEGLLKHFI